MEDYIYDTWLHKHFHSNASKYYKILGQLGSARTCYELAAKGDKSINFLGERLISALKRTANEGELAKIEDELGKYSIRVLLRTDKIYPELLKEIYNPPPILYMRGKGEIINLNRSITIVGTRECTQYGADVAKQFAYELAKCGITIISGMALGIDREAHIGALYVGSPLPTIGVMTCGLDICYPIQNKDVFDIMLERALLISEKPIGIRGKRTDFPVRNRIIAGLGEGCFVVESAMKSGTSHTVSVALDTGREIFALPGRITDKMSQGTNELIKNGATPVSSFYDILIGIKHPASEGKHIQMDKGMEEINQKLSTKAQMMAEELLNDLSDDDKHILLALKEEEKSADELLESTQIPINKLLSRLTKLVHKQIIKRGIYKYSLTEH